MINKLLITLSLPIMKVCCGCCHTTKPSPNVFQVFIDSISLYQWLVVLFAILGIVMLCISVAQKKNPARSRVYQKSSVSFFLIMVGFCANTEICWLVVAVLLVVMLLKFDVLTKWSEIWSKEEKKSEI